MERCRTSDRINQGQIANIRARPVGSRGGRGASKTASRWRKREKDEFRPRVIDCEMGGGGAGVSVNAVYLDDCRLPFERPVIWIGESRDFGDGRGRVDGDHLRLA